jgi:competence protein ComEA
MLRRTLIHLLLLTPLGVQAQQLTEPAPALEINSASRAQLESLAGIGPDLAGRMLLARAAQPFDDWADLLRRVRGLGQARARRLSADGLRVKGAAYSDISPSS